MENKEMLHSLLYERSQHLWDEYLPHISIDCVVFGYHGESLKVLLLKMKGQNQWAIPGGYLRIEEDLKPAAMRILKERTGVSDIYLQQFKTFGDRKRSEGFFEGFDEGLWHKQRFLSVGFYALADYEKVVPVTDDISQQCEWKDIRELPELMMDHKTIFDKALITLRRQLNYKPIGNKLLPEKFTMRELQRLYEIILDKPLNRGNFYRKMKGYGILEKLDESRRSGGAHKAPDLYQFDSEKYDLALRNGLKESW